MNESFNQISIFPYYFIGDQSFLTLQEAALSYKDLTFNIDHKIIWLPGVEKMNTYVSYSKQLQEGIFERSTLFKEIKSRPRIPRDNIRNLYKYPFGKKLIDAPSLASKAIKILEDYILDCWDDSKIYVMSHSSGYDSRLISSILRRLELKNIYFVCWQPEIDSWMKIMRYQEWDQSFLIPVRPDANAIDYYAEILDFQFIGANYSEAERFWAGPALGVKTLKELNLDFSRMTGISALWSDETIVANLTGWPNVGSFVGCYYFDNPSTWLTGTMDIILPFVSEKWIRLMMEYKIPIKKDDFKLEMLRQIDPNMVDLVRFPNDRFWLGPMFKKQGFHSYQVISEETRQKMKSYFLNSWYCKKFKKENILPFFNYVKYYDDKSTDYVKAAICEYLINQGCTIIV